MCIFLGENAPNHIIINKADEVCEKLAILKISSRKDTKSLEAESSKCQEKLASCDSFQGTTSSDESMLIKIYYIISIKLLIMT